MYVAGAKISNQNSSSWCLDIDTRDCVIARRNVLTGLWAGRLLGLSNLTSPVEPHKRWRDPS